jgi:uncharacterized protein YerC
MTKVSKKDLGELEEKIVDDLWEAISSLSGAERIVLLSRLLTPTEIKMFAKRLAILKELRLGKPYGKIEDKYGVMPNTIGRMSNIIHRSGRELSSVIDQLAYKK